jgi:hypothetical protein
VFTGFYLEDPNYYILVHNKVYKTEWKGEMEKTHLNYRTNQRVEQFEHGLPENELIKYRRNLPIRKRGELFKKLQSIPESNLVNDTFSDPKMGKNENHQLYQEDFDSID